MQIFILDADLSFLEKGLLMTQACLEEVVAPVDTPLAVVKC